MLPFYTRQGFRTAWWVQVGCTPCRSLGKVVFSKKSVQVGEKVFNAGMCSVGGGRGAEGAGPGKMGGARGCVGKITKIHWTFCQEPVEKKAHERDGTRGQKPHMRKTRLDQVAPLWVSGVRCSVRCWCGTMRREGVLGRRWCAVSVGVPKELGREYVGGVWGKNEKDVKADRRDVDSVSEMSGGKNQSESQTRKS